MSLPLHGQRVLVTRASAQAGELCERLRSLGAEPVEAAAIAVAPPESWREVDAALRRLNTFQWLVFTSPNGVRHFMGRLAETGTRLAPGTRVAAVGPATAEALRASGVHVALMPERHDAEALAEALVGAGMARARVLMPRGDLADPELPRRLREAGATVMPLVAYRTVPAALDAEGLQRQLEAGAIDWVLVASGSAIRSLAAALPRPEVLRGVRLASIGPKTSAVIRDLGLAVALEAREATLEGLVEALVEA